MKAISLWAPWGTLLHTPTPSHRIPDGVTPQRDYGRACDGPVVKRFETRSWPCPPSVIGQRVAIHQAKRPLRAHGCLIQEVGEYEVVEWRGVHGEHGWHLTGPGGHVELPLGCVVASGVITASLPIVGEWPTTGDLPGPNVPCIYVESNRVPVAWLPGEREGAKITDQLSYGDFTPGRFAWLFDDVKPTTERCPWCWGTGETDDRCSAPHCDGGHACRVCLAKGHCDPIPARGGQRFWNWEPS